MAVITFIVQTKNGHLVHDFAFALREAVTFDTWFYGERRYRFLHARHLPERWPRHAVPVGSLEWVQDALTRLTGRPFPEPTYIPAALRTPGWLGRELVRIPKAACQWNGPRWVKSASQWKGLVDIVSDPRSLPEDDYWVADKVEFTTEWRAFVWQGQLRGIRNYAGDDTLMPHIPTVEAMIQMATPEMPLAWTLDVGVLRNTEGRTVVVETHPFVSCGLYGWADAQWLPVMAVAGWRALVTASGPAGSPPPIPVRTGEIVPVVREIRAPKKGRANDGATATK